MPRMGGLDLLRALKDQLSDITFILLTAQGTVESAVEAIKEGAYDYLSKPVDPQRLQILLQKAVERQETLREVKNAAAAAARAGELRPHHRQQPRHSRRLPRHRAGGADQRVGADLGRVGHRQGADRADDSRAEPAAAVPVRRDQLRRDPGDAARERDLRPRERAPSPARTIAAPACSSWRIAARCSSTRSPRCSRRRRSSCCACCRSGPSGASADGRSRRSTSASSPRPT